MSFSDPEIERYARHLMLREIGGPGQQALKAASVLMVGLGGLGAPAGLYLAASGVGRIGLVDYWRTTGKWPDFCSDPSLPYDCKAEAAKLRPAPAG